MRAIMGIGLGICVPFTTGLIADFFQKDDEQTTLMGFQSSVVNIGGIVTSLLAGIFAAIYWSNAFWVYGIGIIVFLLILFKLPEQTRVVIEGTQKTSLGGIVYFISFLGFLFSALTFPIFANTALLIVEQNFGNAASVGITLTFFSIAGLVAGLIFGKVMSTLNKFTGVFGTIFAGVGFLVITYASSLNMVIVGAILTGFGYSTIIPFLVVNTVINTDRSQTTFAIGILLSCLYLGQFVSPFILINIAKATENTSQMFTFLLCGAILIVSSIVIFLFNLKKSSALALNNK
ncbi:MFS transporter [Desulfosporosinus fructosivorans]